MLTSPEEPFSHLIDTRSKGVDDANRSNFNVMFHVA
jgi:hypothetical protein